MATLLERVQAGKRKVVVSLYHGRREVEYTECSTFSEAAELLARRTVNGFRYSVPEWQWDDYGEGVPAFPEAQVEELGRALTAAGKAKGG